MAKLRKDRWVGCPIRFGLGMFGDQWSLLIIRDLMFRGKRTYGEFLAAGEGISTNILSDRLDKLEQNGLIDKSPDPENGARFIYRLTEKGIDLLPMMLAMVDWAAKYDAETEVPRELLRRLRQNPAAVRQSVRRALKSQD